MKVLWLVNSIMPELAVSLNSAPSVFGGWLTGAMKAVRGTGTDMVICTVDNGAKRTGRYEVNGIVYYIIEDTDDRTLHKKFKDILGIEKPDLVHVFGTEFAYILPMIQAADPRYTTLTLQGTLQYTKDECRAGIPDSFWKDTLFHKLRRLLKKGGESVGQKQREYAKRAEGELEILQSIRNADGCSEWGVSFIHAINPKCRMFNCGCLLRDLFYEQPIWNYDTCEKHSIFALMTRPVKGVHKLIEAMPYVLKQVPDAKLYIGGDCFHYRDYSGIKKWIQDKTPDYFWYIQNLIDRNRLRDHIVFLGYLDESAMKRQLLKVNVFVSPSAQEHLATALGEAMLTGTPSIATSLGALCEMIDHGKDAYLYDFSETHVLAQYICNLFLNQQLAEQFSVNGREHALRTYSKERNSWKLIEMYQTLMNEA